MNGPGALPRTNRRKRAAHRVFLDWTRSLPRRSCRNARSVAHGQRYERDGYLSGHPLVFEAGHDVQRDGENGVCGGKSSPPGRSPVWNGPDAPAGAPRASGGLDGEAPEPRRPSAGRARPKSPPNRALGSPEGGSPPGRSQTRGARSDDRPAPATRFWQPPVRGWRAVIACITDRTVRPAAAWGSRASEYPDPLFSTRSESKSRGVAVSPTT